MVTNKGVEPFMSGRKPDVFTNSPIRHIYFIFYILLAGAEGIEPSLVVLETTTLPLRNTPILFGVVRGI